MSSEENASRIRRRRRIGAALGALLGAAFILSYCGWHHVGCGIENPQWSAPLEYPNRGEAAQLRRENFSSAQVCAACHVQHYAEWKESGMGRSVERAGFLIELYRVGLDLRGAPPEDAEQCLTCHAPLALMSEKADLDFEDELSREGVNCDVCHTAIHGIGNDAPGMLKWDPKGPKLGPFWGSQDGESPEKVAAISPFHGTKHSPLHESSELCGSCHMSTWPTNALPIDWTFAEWKRSPYAARGVTCQSCHMPTYSGQAAPGAPVRANLHRHTFKGGGDRELVRSAAKIDLKHEAHYAGYEIEVRVENSGAGHAFPTGNASAPVVALEVEGVTKTGEIVFRERREYKLTYGDAAGNECHDATSATKVLRDTTLQPLEPRFERFFLPRHLGASRFRARLVYQRWNNHVNGTHALSTLADLFSLYLVQGFRVHRLLAHLGVVRSGSLTGIASGVVVVDEGEVEILADRE